MGLGEGVRAREGRYVQGCGRRFTCAGKIVYVLARVIHASLAGSFSALITCNLIAGYARVGDKQCLQPVHERLYLWLPASSSAPNNQCSAASRYCAVAIRHEYSRVLPTTKEQCIVRASL